MLSGLRHFLACKPVYSPVNKLLPPGRSAVFAHHPTDMNVPLYGAPSQFGLNLERCFLLPCCRPAHQRSTSSQIQRMNGTFWALLDSGTEIDAYAKLPKSFSIPTPVAGYTRLAIAFK